MKLFFGKKSDGKAHQDAPDSTHADEIVATSTNAEDDEVAVVIALAINLYITRIREIEKVSLTLEKAIKPYSPWSSKIYGLRQQPMFLPNLKSRLK